MASRAELMRLLEDMRAYNLRRPPKQPDAQIAAVWHRKLGEYPIDELQDALDALLDTLDEPWWPTPIDIRRVLLQRRQHVEGHRREAAQRGGCDACGKSGVRTVTMWLEDRGTDGRALPDDLGYPRIRRIESRIAACDCSAGRLRLGTMPWHVLSQNLSERPGSRVFVTGSEWRYHPDDLEPGSLWFVQSSPEELYGPRKAAGLRDTAYRVQDAGSRAPKVAADIISNLFRKRGWLKGA